MAIDYKKLKGTVDRVMSGVKQGVITMEVVTEVAATNPWDIATIDSTPEVVNAIVSGISEQFIDGIVVLKTDLMVTMAVPSEYKAGAVLNIDGKPVTTVKVFPIPAAGDPVLLKIAVR